jgi:hypothetical protein
MEKSLLSQRPFIGLLYQPLVIDCDDCRAINGINEWHGKSKYSEEIYTNVSLFITDPI